LAKQLEAILKLNDFHVESFQNAEDFLLSKFSFVNCLYLIDLQLPGIQGKELINLIRVKDKFSPIFILSGNFDDQKITDVLKCGADDYVQKPYNPDHLLGKLVNAFKKLETFHSDQMSVGIKLVPEADLVMREGKALRLTSKEFSIIEQLLKDREKIHCREDLIEHIGSKEITARTIDVHVSGLRKKLEIIDLEIETVRGKGYKILVKDPVT
jgi:DNA-binding response OmpR family regulator